MKYLLGILLTSVALCAQAQVDSGLSNPFLLGPDGRHELNISGGLFRPISTFNLQRTTGFTANDRFGRTGYMFALDYLINLNQTVALGTEWAYVTREQQQITNVYDPSLPFVTRVRGDSNLIFGLVRLKSPGTGFRPHVTGGVGWYRTRLNVYGAWPAGGPEASFINDAKTGLAWTLRTGFEYTNPLGSFIAADLGYIRTDTKSYGATPAGLASGFLPVNSAGSGITLTARVGIRVGSPRVDN
ncbi:MAG: hypothetical protein AAB036_12030 [Elusimicrobiota bacterium]